MARFCRAMTGLGAMVDVNAMLLQRGKFNGAFLAPG